MPGGGHSRNGDVPVCFDHPPGVCRQPEALHCKRVQRFGRALISELGCDRSGDRIDGYSPGLCARDLECAGGFFGRNAIAAALLAVFDSTHGNRVGRDGGEPREFAAFDDDASRHCFLQPEGEGAAKAGVELVDAVSVCRESVEVFAMEWPALLEDRFEI